MLNTKIKMFVRPHPNISDRSIYPRLWVLPNDEIMLITRISGVLIGLQALSTHCFMQGSHLNSHSELWPQGQGSQLVCVHIF